jgi:hypothetical protein
VVPVKLDGSKAPDLSGWKAYQRAPQREAHHRLVSPHAPQWPTSRAAGDWHRLWKGERQPGVDRLR